MVRMPSRDLIKEWIMTYGSVTVNYEANENNYNSKTYAWYNPNSEDTNHEVCIVGWDDTFAKENFKQAPAGDGAWIIKNSWGAEWGKDGFFYLSYYDSSILLPKTQYTVFDMEYGKYADNVYQNAFEVQESFYTTEDGKKDYMNPRNGAPYSKVANVFTAQANESGGEVLKGVSLYTLVPLEYEIKIYKNVKESSNPESGILTTTITGRVDDAGFKIIPLNTSIYLSQGESYSIVASTKNEKGESVGVAASTTYYINPTPTFFQSYVYRNKRTGWEDLAVVNNTNLYLNAYTDNVPADANADKNKVTMNVSSPGIETLPLPKDVTGVNVTYAGSDSVILSWDRVEEIEYIVYQCNVKANAWRKVDIVESGKDYYEVTGLLPGTSYKFAVKSVAKKDSSINTDQTYLQSINYVSVEVKTPSNVNVTPTLIKKSGGNVLEWDRSPNATRYEVYVLSPVTDYEWSKLATVSAHEALRYEDANVIKGLTYMYRIYAYNGNNLLGKGTPSSILFE